MNTNSNNMNDNKIDAAHSYIDNVNKKEKTKEETAKDKESSVVATVSCIQVACNDSYQAVAAKYCKAWEEIKQYPNTCRYFEPTESQLWLIV